MSFYYYKDRNKVKLSYGKANNSIRDFYGKTEYDNRYLLPY